MEVTLVSEDSEISKLCTAVLTDVVQGRSWSLTSSNVEGLRSPADLYLWDFQPNVLPEAPVKCTSHNLVAVVNRRDLPALKKFLGFEPNILLKPVTAGTLSAVLHFAVSSRTTESLRDDREQLLQNLLETNLKLQEYDQERTNFLTRVVHDFRAPLTALSGYCGLLLSEPFGALNDNQKEVIRRMQYSATRLSRMATAMLQLSVERQVKRRPDFQRGDIQKSLEQALYEIAPVAEDKRIKINSNLAPCSESLYFEPAQIDQVLVNVLDNACRFTPKAGTIEITGYFHFWERRNELRQASVSKDRRVAANQEPNCYRIDIRDSGTPIPEEHLEGIFEEYTPLAQGRDRSGGGLGLAICRMIMTRHDGWIWAENTAKGPMFSLVVPFRRFNSAHLTQTIEQYAPGEHHG